MNRLIDRILARVYLRPCTLPRPSACTAPNDAAHTAHLTALGRLNYGPRVHRISRSYGGRR